MVGQARKAARLLAERGIEATVYNMLWVKPVDEEAIQQTARTPLVVTLEEGAVTGGFGAAVLEALAQASIEGKRPPARVLNIGVPDSFIEHGRIEQLFEELGLTAPQIAERIARALEGSSE
jgi:1-deoxy-D-xylulose-5-phosphate synthase